MAWLSGESDAVRGRGSGAESNAGSGERAASVSRIVVEKQFENPGETASFRW